MKIKKRAKKIKKRVRKEINIEGTITGRFTSKKSNFTELERNKTPTQNMGGFTAHPPEHCELKIFQHGIYWVDNVVCNSRYCEIEHCERFTQRKNQRVIKNSDETIYEID